MKTPGFVVKKRRVDLYLRLGPSHADMWVQDPLRATRFVEHAYALQASLRHDAEPVIAPVVAAEPEAATFQL